MRDKNIPEDLRKEWLADLQKEYEDHLRSKLDYIPKHDVSVSNIYEDNILYEGKPTDNLVALIRKNGDYDGVLTQNVYDGGGGHLPPTDTFAFIDSSQVKSKRNLGTFSPNLRDIYRSLGPAMLGGTALAATMGRPTGASAAALPSGWVPPSAKDELQGMEPEGWMDPVDRIVDVLTAGGGVLARVGQAGLGMAQDWAAEHLPQLPEVPEEHYEAAQ